MMLLVQLIACFALIFLAGVHWSAYKIDGVEGKTNKNSLSWCIVLSALGIYHLIALIGGY